MRQEKDEALRRLALRVGQACGRRPNFHGHKIQGDDIVQQVASLDGLFYGANGVLETGQVGDLWAVSDASPLSGFGNVCFRLHRQGCVADRGAPSVVLEPVTCFWRDVVLGGERTGMLSNDGMLEQSTRMQDT